MPSGNARKRKAKKSAAKNSHTMPQTTQQKEESSNHQTAEFETPAETGQFHSLDAANNIACDVNGTETIEDKLEPDDTGQGVNGEITGKQQQQQINLAVFTSRVYF